LGAWLREGPLVGRGVGHGDGGAVDQADAAAVPAPVGRTPRLQVRTGLAQQSGEQPLGEALAGFAVGAGVGRAGGPALTHQPGQEAGHGLAAGVVGVEDLAEEDPEGGDGGEGAAAAGGGVGGQGLLDDRSGGEVGEGQTGLVAPALGLLGVASALAGTAAGVRMRHRRPACLG